MRKFWIYAAASAASLLAGAAFAGGPACAAPACAAPAPSCGAEPACGAATGHCGDDPCDDGCGHGCGLGRHWGRRGAKYEGLDAAFNCGCNGSYKFPVPPLYTYHWPGMYQQNLMTDYHSPWRFPPLKPYVDELPAVEMGSLDSLSEVHAASYSVNDRVVGECESMSSRMLRSR